MKKVLEILQYGDMDIRFDTDIKITERDITELLPKISFNMATRLWGGNEQTVLAVIRLLAIADLSLCSNREFLIRQMDENSEMLARSMQEARKQFVEGGGKIIQFPPEIMPKDIKS